MKELQRKEEIKEKKSKNVAEQLQVVSSDMISCINLINRGVFPNPSLSLQEVSCLFQCANHMSYIS
jgi:hypothetical protein